MSDLEQAIEAAMPYVTTSRGVAAIRRVALVSRIEALGTVPCSRYGPDSWCEEPVRDRCARCALLAEAEKALGDA